MAMKITKAKDIKKAGATVFLFGESGTGKTTALKTLPGKTLIFDIEGGTSVLRGSDVDIVTIPHGLTGFKEAIDEICLMEKNPYDNVCLDSLTEVQTCMLVAMANASKTQSPTLQDYGIVQFKIRDYCRRLRDLRERGINVVITALQVALEIEQNEDVTRTCLYPLLMKKLSPEVCGLFDVVAHMEVSSKKETMGKRYFRLDGNENVMAKNRLAKVGDLPYCEADFKKLLA